MTTPEQKHIDKQPPVKVTRCHARFNEPPYLRCELEGGHNDMHTVSTTWDEDECFDPDREMAQALVSEVLSGRMIQPASPTPAFPYIEDVDLPPASWEGQGKPGGCFSCGCPSEDHPCDAHDCRSFVA